MKLRDETYAVAREHIAWMQENGLKPWHLPAATKEAVTDWYSAFWFCRQGV
jgi:hypothetical protein